MHKLRMRMSFGDPFNEKMQERGNKQREKEKENGYKPTSKKN